MCGSILVKVSTVHVVRTRKQHLAHRAFTLSKHLLLTLCFPKLTHPLPVVVFMVETHIDY